MANVFDVAQYILEKLNTEITTIKLQKFVYYCQAWSLVWTETPLFEEEIQAWANGPVVPALYARHQGIFKIGPSHNCLGGNSQSLTDNERENIDCVLHTYGEKEPMWLVQLSHVELPWKEARGSLPPGVRCTNVISHASMAEYYMSL